MRMKLSVVAVICLMCALCCEVGSWSASRKRRSLRRTLPAPYVPKDDSTKAEWFQQKLDHFNSKTTATWKQKYYTNAKYHKAGGPIFLYVSGEGDADPGWMVDAACIDYAKEFHALCFQLEHRFYGGSHPTRDISVEHLSYLSSQQALADLASFIRGMTSKHNLPADTKWVAFGGSYAGALAAWLRLKYPDLLHAAVSSSAPLLAVADFKDFLGNVATSLSTSGESCVKAIQSATKQMDSMLTSSSGLKALESQFSVCESLESASSKDVSNLYLTLADYIADEVQGNDNDWQSWNASSTNIDAICGVMEDSSYGSALDRYSAVNNMLANLTGSCLDVSYSGSVDYLRATSWGSDADGDRQWMYQTCTEFGYFDTSSLTPHVFGSNFPLDFFVQQCTEVFGSRFNKTSLNAAVARTNKMYGGLSIKVSNVVFLQGSIDPWHTLGITKSISSSAPAIFIQGTSHCGDMYSSSSYDLPQLTAAHKEIRNILKKWL